MRVCVINYNAGNTESVRNALLRIEVEPILSDDPDVIRSADKVIFPGVGEASTAMKYLRERELDEVIKSLDQPVLGICLGMQLLCAYSEENSTELLGLLDCQAERFDETSVRVPHVGWNKLLNTSGDLFEGVEPDTYVYFVHSYKVPVTDETIAECEYGGTFAAAVRKDNFFGVQFHTEKSGVAGEQILRNFLKL